MIIVACLVSVVAIVALAVRGVAYRGAYFAAGVAAFAAGLLVMELIPGPALVLPDDPAQRAGAAFMREYFPGLVYWLYSVAVGGVIGGIAFRKVG